MAFAVGLLFGAKDAGAQVSPIPFAVLLVLLAAVNVAALRLSWRWWKTADEAVRQAHMSGYFYGGSLATCVALCIAALLLAAPSLAAPLGMALGGPEAVFAAGAFFCFFLQLIGYGAGWAVWWLRASR
ncbi:hypothetical protein P7B02_16865 [Caulobacter segnis]|uniref:hypothetical protein n=1 Tax=Caulobacter segnis TaxID=88688 RepID=UPI00240F397D|nr:hypothetical protein [Caulobacter segnis]MDG2523204.1 hypothetical protein [Caulobacter segnis]